MLRFFRHIRKKLVEQEKIRTYFFYAIGEILLVVIGILIALQVNNWNELRKDNNKEIIYLERFAEDLNANILEMVRAISTLEVAIDNAELILSLKKENKLSSKSPDSLFMYLFNIGNYSIFQSREGTIKSIMESGNIELISDPEIRTAIATWDAGLAMIRGWESHGEITQEKFTSSLMANIPVYAFGSNNNPMDEETFERYFADLETLNIIWERKFVSEELLGMYLVKEKEFLNLRDEVRLEIDSRK